MWQLENVISGLEGFSMAMFTKRTPAERYDGYYTRLPFLSGWSVDGCFFSVVIGILSNSEKNCHEIKNRLAWQTGFCPGAAPEPHLTPDLGYSTLPPPPLTLSTPVTRGFR